MITNELQHATVPKVHREPRLLPPRRLIEEASRRIVGQDRAKAALAKALYGFQLYPALRRNVLLVGPPHCGMTAVAEEMAKAAGLPIVFPDIGEYLSAGRNPNEMVPLLLREIRQQRLPQKQIGIICISSGEQLALDEANLDSRKQSLQLAIGQLAFGKTVNSGLGGKPQSIHTSRIMFLLQIRADQPSSLLPAMQTGGSAAQQANVITQDLVRLGFHEKLLEPFALRAPFHALSEPDFLEICYGNQILAPLHQAFAQHRVILQFSDAALEQLADRAFALGSGAGGIAAIALSALDGVLPRLVEPGCCAQRVVVQDLSQSPEIVTGPPLIPPFICEGEDALPEHLRALFPQGLPPRPAQAKFCSTGGHWANEEDLSRWIT